MRTIKQEICGANIIELTISHNGYRGGDSGHGGFVEISIKDLAGTDMMINGKEVNEFTLRVQGDSERTTFLDAFKVIVNELENNRKV